MMSHAGSLLDVDLARIPRAFVRDRDEEVYRLLARADDGDKSGFGIQALVRLSYRPPGKYPLKSTLFCDERFQTLRNCHDDLAAMPLEKLRIIARAGFYRCGMTTTLTCFHCGCQASNWRVDDDPWERHAELKPNCPVIKRGVVICREGGRPVDRVLMRQVSC
ncbi:E3 ubiquitin-protein ligase XIAP-like isoform X2 [Haliotis rubra]|uniref:E3 ubiquitin-protein ligase XIAP-like isoform X2 n=1 Tax=Haliotis rubra TaxID=36100 RepID=UPI001EE504E2|nr:E3 ubiquitin-protein ligase XIAP-like isoform X2 [Haliotis rubra]